jgi:hypothetical protein
MNKPKIWWCIKVGKLLLPFTARITREQTKLDFTRSRNRELTHREKCVKIEIREAKP